MKKSLLSFILLFSVFSALSFSPSETEKAPLKVPAELTSEAKERLAEEAYLKLYQKINYAGFAKPDFQIFKKGVTGFINLRNQQQEKVRNILTLIDFNIPSNTKRMWVIDFSQMKVLFHELVAHGRNSGENFATTFSNTPNSNTSSLGFYLTGEEYTGKYGLSLRLDGMEKGFNDLARERAIVLHGADYVSQAFADAQGRLGRSFGCPAVSYENKDAIVNILSDRSVMFIDGPDARYQAGSRLLDKRQVVDYLASREFQLMGLSAPVRM